MPPCRLNSQPSPTASSTAAPANRSLVAAPGRRRPAAGEALKRLHQAVHRRPLVLGRVAPDERQAGDAEHLRPGVDLDRPSFSTPARKQEHGEQRRQGRARAPRRASRAWPGCAMRGLIALGRDQQPAEHVERHRPAVADQRGHGERDPHRGRAEAAPRRETGRDAAGQPVLRVAAQRLAVTAVAPLPGAVDDPVGHVAVPRRLPLPAGAGPGRRPCQPGPCQCGSSSCPARPVRWRSGTAATAAVSVPAPIHHHPPNPIRASGRSPDTCLAPLRVRAPAGQGRARAVPDTPSGAA